MLLEGGRASRKGTKEDWVDCMVVKNERKRWRMRRKEKLGRPSRFICEQREPSDICDDVKSTTAHSHFGWNASQLSCFWQVSRSICQNKQDQSSRRELIWEKNEQRRARGSFIPIPTRPPVNSGPHALQIPRQTVNTQQLNGTDTTPTHLAPEFSLHQCSSPAYWLQILLLHSYDSDLSV